MDYAKLEKEFYAKPCDKNGKEIKEGDVFFWDEGTFGGIQYNKAVGYVTEDSGELYCQQVMYWNMDKKVWEQDKWSGRLSSFNDSGFEIIGHGKTEGEISEMALNY